MPLLMKKLIRLMIFPLFYMIPRGAQSGPFWVGRAGYTGSAWAPLGPQGQFGSYSVGPLLALHAAAACRLTVSYSDKEVFCGQVAFQELKTVTELFRKSSKANN